MSAPQAAGKVAVRRSPLTERHRALGARWVSDVAEWPRSYAGAQPDRAALRTMLWLADWGPLDKLTLRGDQLSTRAPGPQFASRTISTGRLAGRAVQLWGLTDDEALLLAPAPDADASRALAGELQADGIAFEDQSSQQVVLRLGGPTVRTVLEGVLPYDVSEAAFPDRSIAFGPLAGVRVTFGRFDHDGSPAFTILAERDYAEYLWDILLRAPGGRPQQLTPVGVASLGEV